jgi:uncharacterized protein YbaR (Trm112 family)
MKLSSELLKLLVCPSTVKPLFYDKEGMILVNKEDGLSYPVVDGIPLLLPTEAKKILVKGLIN